MSLKRALLLFSLFTSLLLASEPRTETIWSAEALEPNAIFNGSVNVITGQYVEHVADIRLRGVERLAAVRGICGEANSRTNGKVIGWTMGQPSLTTYGKGEPNRRHISDRDILACDLNGSRILFKSFSRAPALWNPSARGGICNTGWGEVSGKTHPINRLITYEGENRYKLRLGSGQEQHYLCWSNVRERDVPKRDKLSYYLKEAVQPNGHHLELEWGEDWLLQKVIAKNEADSQVLGWLTYDYTWRDNTKEQFPEDASDILSSGEPVNSIVVGGVRLIETTAPPGGRVIARPLEAPYDGYAIESSDGQRVEYALGPYGRLDKVQVRGQPKICYQYQLGELHRYCSDSARRVEARWQPEGRYLENIYYRARENQLSDRRIYLEGRNFNSGKVDHPAVGRVCEQFGPVGPGGSRHVMATYVYHFHLDRHRNPEEVAGWTEVWDAKRDRTTFYYSADKRLTSIDRYQGGDHKLLHEEYVYGSERPYLGNLLGKSLCDGAGQPLAALTFQYDNRGNVLSKRLWGALTGRDGVALQLGNNGLPTCNGAESCEKEFIYPEEEDNRLLIEIDGNRRTEFSYWGKTDLVRSRLVRDGEQIFERHFYWYDENGALTEYSWDNGQTEGDNDLTGATWRRVRRVIPVSSGVAIGLPKRVEEWYWDGESHMLGAVEFTYNHRNFIVAETVFDAENVARYMIETEHDEGGRPLLRRGPLGYETWYGYDVNGNLLSEFGPRPGCGKIHTYDRANRRISTQIIGPNGECQWTRHRYDPKGNCIETEDDLGNRTESEFDALGRLVLQRFPDGAERQYVYNALGHKISEINELGEETRYRYNVRGQVIEERFPDGTFTAFEYTPYGLPVRSVSREGVITEGSYNRVGHLLTLTIRSPDGGQVREISFRYDGDRLIFTRDGEGNERHYRYDGAGRLIAEWCGESWIGYLYDSLGRPCCKQISFGGASGEHREEWTEYDLLGRVVEERVADSQGRVLRRIGYRYDEVGNRTEVVTYGNAARVERTDYDAFNRPICMTDPLGNTTFTEYTHVTNELGQQVVQTIVTDPLEQRTITTFDARGRPVQTESLDRSGATLLNVKRSYDLAGNATAEQTNDHSVRWVRGPMGRIEEMTEGESRVTQYQYNRQGQVVAKVNPSGEVTKYGYDRLSRVVEEAGTGYHYRYEFDRNDNVVRATDGLGNETVRTFDQHNWLISEKQSTGLTIAYRRDHMGRSLELQLPDGSAIVRSYDAADLISVGRRDRAGELLYRHLYTARDLSGRILSERLIGQAGEVVRTWNGQGGLLASEGASLSERLKYDSLGRLIERNRERYSYDALSQLIEEGQNFTPLGNRYRVNPFNELVESGYEHDQTGCLAVAPGRLCRFDGRGRLIEVIADGRVHQYTYDPFDRRVEERRGEEVIQYLYDGNVEIAALQDGEIAELRLLGEGIDSDIGAMVAVELAGQPYAVRSDYRGSVAALLDLSGELAEEYRYSPFGKGGGGLSPWGFSSKRVDPTGLVYFGFRHYDPELGRWISPDPMSFSTGPNLYAFCGNDPLNRIDPNGLWYAFMNHRVPVSYPNRGFSYRVLELTNYLFESRSLAEFSPVTYIDNFEAHYPHKSSRYSLGELHGDLLPEFPGGRLMFVNGMNTSYETAVGHSEYLSKLSGGYNVHGVWNASYSKGEDIRECALQLYYYHGTDPVRLVQESWDEFFSTAEPNQLIYLVCQSQAMIIIRNALLDYNKEGRKRIMVLGVAPAAYVYEEISGYILHLISPYDPIPLADFKGRWTCRKTIRYVRKHPSAKLPDHAFQSPSYKEDIQDQLKVWSLDATK
jgi:RHS repeat-associated protein